MGEEHLDPAWDFGPEGERFEVEVQGDPSTFVTIKGWQPEPTPRAWSATPASIPYVVAADPGIKTYLDLPLVAGRAHPDQR